MHCMGTYKKKKFIKILYGLLITICCCIRLELKKTTGKGKNAI